MVDPPHDPADTPAEPFGVPGVATTPARLRREMPPGDHRPGRRWKTRVDAAVRGHRIDEAVVRLRRPAS